MDLNKKANKKETKALTLSAGIFLILFLLGGCAAKKELAGLKQDHQVLRGQVQDLQKRNDALETKANELEQNASNLNVENGRLKNQLVSARASLNELSNQEPECPENMIKGVVFKVQIGAFKEREISKDLDQSVNMSIEEKAEYDKMIVGQFRDYKKADRLKKHLRAMGIENAWIVPYRDNERVELSEVLDEIEL